MYLHNTITPPLSPTLITFPTWNVHLSYLSLTCPPPTPGTNPRSFLLETLLTQYKAPLSQRKDPTKVKLQPPLLASTITTLQEAFSCCLYLINLPHYWTDFMTEVSMRLCCMCLQWKSHQRLTRSWTENSTWASKHGHSTIFEKHIGNTFTIFSIPNSQSPVDSSE